MQKSPLRADFSGGSAGRAGRRRRLKGKRGRGTLTKEKPPSFGMSQRTGAVVIRMLENVQQVTIGPLIEGIMAKESVVDTHEYDTSSRLNDWRYNHETVCHEAGKCACDEDAEGFCQAHVTTLEGFWSWLRPHRGIAREKLPLSLGFFEFVHSVRVRGKALLGELIGLLVASPGFQLERPGLASANSVP
jgi:transposase